MGIESVPKFEKEPTTVYLSVQTNFMSDLVVRQAYNGIRKDYEAPSVGIAVIQPLSEHVDKRSEHKLKSYVDDL